MTMTKLPSGTTGFYNDKNEWVCTGSQMGRRSFVDTVDVCPHCDGSGEEPGAPVSLTDGKALCGDCKGTGKFSPKVSLRRLRWVDGDYDEAGAYWGYCSGTWIYRAIFETADSCEDIFVRATSREDAKEQVREQLPGARFYN